MKMPAVLSQGLIPGLPGEQRKAQGFWVNKHEAYKQMKALTAVTQKARTPTH